MGRGTGEITGNPLWLPLTFAWPAVFCGNVWVNRAGKLTVGRDAGLAAAAGRG